MVQTAVAVVEDDPSVRSLLAHLIHSAGWACDAYETAPAFLQDRSSHSTACLVLDIDLPGMSGIQLQRELAHEELSPSIIFLTGYADISTAVHAMRNGAVEFLTKPFLADDLLQAIERGVRLHQLAARRFAELEALRTRTAGLTAREWEVFFLVTQGFANKHIAAHLRIAEATVKVHRGQVMRKLEAKSMADLVTLSVRLGLQRDVAPLGSTVFPTSTTP